MGCVIFCAKEFSEDDDILCEGDESQLQLSAVGAADGQAAQVLVLLGVGKAAFGLLLAFPVQLSSLRQEHTFPLLAQFLLELVADHNPALGTLGTSGLLLTPLAVAPYALVLFVLLLLTLPHFRLHPHLHQVMPL